LNSAVCFLHRDRILARDSAFSYRTDARKRHLMPLPTPFRPPLSVPRFVHLPIRISAASRWAPAWNQSFATHRCQSADRIKTLRERYRISRTLLVRELHRCSPLPQPLAIFPDLTNSARGGQPLRANSSRRARPRPYFELSPRPRAQSATSRITCAQSDLRVYRFARMRIISQPPWRLGWLAPSTRGSRPRTAAE